MPGAPLLAHATGPADLPVPTGQVLWVAAAVVVVGFVVLAASWPRPRLAAASAGRLLPGGVATAVRVVGLLARVVVLGVFVTVVVAGVAGNEFPAANLAPVAVFVTFWVGGLLVSPLLGDVWRAVSPWRTLAEVAARLNARVRGRPLGPAADADGATHWPAVVAVAAFVWLELAYHTPSSPRVLGWTIVAYTVTILAAAARRGRGWLDHGEGFGVLFGLLAHLAPVFGDDHGRLRARWPLAGVARVRLRPGTLVLLLIALGSTAFDGLSRTRFWFDLLQGRHGWGVTAVNTVGLIWSIGAVALVYVVATRLVARTAAEDGDEVATAFAPAVLLPLAAALAFAHYASLFVLDGQAFWIGLSDPLGRGWDLFGTADGTVDYRLLSTTTISWLQVTALVAGHLAALVAIRDRALERYRPRTALRAQYPLLVVVVASTIGSLALVLR